MRKILLVVLLSITGFGFALQGFTLAEPDKTPVQSYHSADSPTMPTIKPGVSKHQFQMLAQQVQSLQASMAQQTSDLAQQLAKLEKSDTAQQTQKLAGQVLKLTAEQQTLTMQVQQMTANLNNIQQQLQQFQTTMSQDNFANESAHWLNALGAGGVILAFAILLLVIIILLILIFKKSKPVVTEVASEKEYDFMASDESTPAKLDLAEAYIAMDDFASARKLLNEIKQIGDEAQRAKAEKLLTDIHGKE